MRWLLLDEGQLKWYGNNLGTDLRYYRRGYENHLHFATLPVTTNRFAFNRIDLRGCGRDLNKWADKIKGIK